MLLDTMMPSIYAQGPKLLMATLLVLKQDGLAVSGRGLVWHFNDLLDCRRLLRCSAWLGCCVRRKAPVCTLIICGWRAQCLSRNGDLCSAQLRLSLALDR